MLCARGAGHTLDISSEPATGRGLSLKGSRHVQAITVDKRFSASPFQLIGGAFKSRALRTFVHITMNNQNKPIISVSYGNLWRRIRNSDPTFSEFVALPLAANSYFETRSWIAHAPPPPNQPAMSALGAMMSDASSLLRWLPLRFHRVWEEHNKQRCQRSNRRAAAPGTSQSTTSASRHL